MPRPAKKRKKRAGVGLCCPKCSGRLYVETTRARGRSAVDRWRRCDGCREVFQTAETFKAK